MILRPELLACVKGFVVLLCFAAPVVLGLRSLRSNEVDIGSAGCWVLGVLKTDHEVFGGFEGCCVLGTLKAKSELGAVCSD